MSKNCLIGLLVMALLFGVGAPAHAQVPGPNLLVDGDFEAPPVWPMQDGIGEVQVAPGWRAWYLDAPPSYVVPPASCYDKNQLKDTGCYWMRPEFRDTVAAAFENRVHGGIRAQKYFSFGRMHQGGLLQHVTGVTPGAVLRFSIYIQAWMCHDINACGKKGERSDAPSNMHLRVGIDPYGGTDPFSANIVWSPEQDAFDRWVEFSVQATAQSNAVTVFTHSRPEWDWARKDNDVYLDDASLVQIGGPGAAAPTAAVSTPAPTNTPGPSPTPGPTRTQAPSPTPRADGAVVHIVQAGDTLFGIALDYGVPVETLYTLNNLGRDAILEIGQQLVIRAGPASTPTGMPTVVTPTLPPPTATPAPGGLCVDAFEDANVNNVRDGGESSLAGVTFVVTAKLGADEVMRYTTDGAGQPHCLAGLSAGAYILQVTPPAGYGTAIEQVEVELTTNRRVEVVTAARRGVKATATAIPTKAPTATLAPAAGGEGASSMPLLIGGAALLAIVAAAAIVLRKRPDRP